MVPLGQGLSTVPTKRLSCMWGVAARSFNNFGQQSLGWARHSRGTVSWHSQLWV